MAVYRPTMVFTQLQSSGKNKSPMNLIDPNAVNDFEAVRKINPNDKHITVSAVGEVTQSPSKCRITITVTAKKDEAQDAKSSVSRRVEYIQQCLGNYGVKEKDKDVFERLARDGKTYIMKTDITAQFSDVEKCQSLSNLLVEKLDQNVEVSLPEFFHDDKNLESLRKQASLLAIHNAKLKAQEMAKFVHMEVGRPTLIQEEEVHEIHPSTELSSSVHQRKLDAAFTVSSKVSVQFELKKKNKHKS